MKKVFAAIWAGIMSILGDIDWKPIIHDALMKHLVPSLRKAAADTEKKWDDVMVNGLERIIQTFLGADPEPEIVAPPA